MSTKTTFKRVALVAVAALGLGVISSVAPATAIERTPVSISVASNGALRAGVSGGTLAVTFNLPAGYALGDSIIVGARVTSAPATSFATSKSAVPGTAAISSSTPTTAQFNWSKPASGSGSFGTLNATDVRSSAGDGLNPAQNSGAQNWTVAREYLSITSSADSTATQTLLLNFTPDVSGSYTILFYVGSTAAAYDTQADLGALATSTIGANLTTTTFTATTSGTPATAEITSVSGSTITGATGGALYKLTLKDSTGATAALGTGEAITLASTTSTVSFFRANNSTAISAGLTNADFRDGVAFFVARNSATGTATFTATGSGLLSTSVTGSSSITTVVGSAGAPTIGKLSTNTALVAGTTSGQTIPYTASTSATSHSLVVTGTAANVEGVTVTDTNGKITGATIVAGSSTFVVPSYVVPVTIGTAGTATVSVTGTLLAAEAVTVAVISTASTGATTNTITGATRVNTTLAVTDGTRRVAAASTNTFVVNVKDQFGGNRDAQTVLVTVAGRNPRTSTNILTDSSGNATYTLVDAGTVGTVDTITFTSTASTTATVSYGTTTVTKLAIAGPNSPAGVVDTNVLLAEKIDINAAVAGAQGTVAPVTVTATDAAGLVMAGIPVTFSVAGTTAAILSTKVTVYTGADGKAATSVYAWANGVYVVTATAGGQTATDSVHFAQQTATEARTIKATVKDNVVTGLVQDRFGNPVPGVTIWASEVGVGYFGSGAKATTGVTDESGTVDFFINGATSDTVVTLALGSTTSVDKFYGQSGSLLGGVTQNDGGTPTAVTATTVGTTTTAETGVGAAFAPAGINSASATVVGAPSAAEANAQAANDAAAEATDAANAATDAANAAAEAADAATAAAQDAADAVAALSTQVTEMVNALKKQITALTNLVIKIQKKVKA